MHDAIVRADTLPMPRDIATLAYQVLPDIWISPMPKPDWPLDEWAIGLVVSLSDHLPPQAARRSQWGTRGEAMGDGRIMFLHWPIEDGSLPNATLTHLLVSTITHARRLGLRVLIHCEEGRNRSALIASLVVRQILGVTGQEAVVVVRAARPGALTNRTFAKELALLEKP
jgi:hypothetical protein